MKLIKEENERLGKNNKNIYNFYRRNVTWRLFRKFQSICRRAGQKM